MSNEQITVVAQRPLWALWPRWILATTGGGVAGGVAGGLAGLVPLVLGLSWLLNLGGAVATLGFLGISAGVLLGGATAGLVMGSAQARALRANIPAGMQETFRSAWAKAGVLGGSLGVFVFSAARITPFQYGNIDLGANGLPVLDVLSWLVGAGIIGLAQWRVLRPYTRHALWWIPANIVGWGAGVLSTRLSVIAVIGDDLEHSGSSALITGVLILYSALILVTVVYGVITGPVIALLLRHSYTTPLEGTTASTIDLPLPHESGRTRNFSYRAGLALGIVVAVLVLLGFAQKVHTGSVARQHELESTAPIRDIPLYPGTITGNIMEFQAANAGFNQLGQDNVFRSFNVPERTPDEVGTWYTQAFIQPPWSIVQIDQQERDELMADGSTRLISYCIQVQRDLGDGTARPYYWEIFGGPTPSKGGTHVNIGTPHPINAKCKST